MEKGESDCGKEWKKYSEFCSCSDYIGGNRKIYSQNVYDVILSDKFLNIEWGDTEEQAREKKISWI